LTLSGTNTWVVGRGPAWIVDPGPSIDEHLQRLYEAIDSRGGLAGIVLTHDHSDHSAAVPQLRERHPSAPLAGARGDVDVVLADGERVGPFCALAAPGHSSDSYALIAHGACFSGDAVLGSGSVFVAPHPGAMAGYMHALQRLLSREDFQVICPGHGPVVQDARAKLSEYLDHRRARERALIDALARGLRSERELLDEVWSDVPEQLRPAAGFTLAAHLDKLADEGRLPEGVARPAFEEVEW
jgi:glyoxylase-like metal-dependent hydrolase (beta-lactamase superfamily II)